MQITFSFSEFHKSFKVTNAVKKESHENGSHGFKCITLTHTSISLVNHIQRRYMRFLHQNHTTLRRYAINARVALHSIENV